MPADPLRDRAAAQHGAELARTVAGVRCHLYLRVSSPDQDLDVGPDGRPVRVRRSKDDREREVKRSLDTQEAEGRAYAERMGYHVAVVYREIYTSQAFWDRPELARLREAIVGGTVDVVVCLKTERLGGTSTQVGALEYLLERHGARLEFVLQQFEDSPTGRIVKNVMVEFNSLRIESLKEQFSRNKRARLDAGRTLHGPKTPYGTVWADEARTHYRFLPPESLEWQVLRSAFLDVIAGVSQNAVAGALTRRRVPAPKGGPVWYQRTLGAIILRNPLYCGEPAGLRYRNDIEQRNGRRVRHQVLTPEGAGPGLREPEGRPPVTPEEFARAQAQLDANAERQTVKRGSRLARRTDYQLLGGYAVCALCGEPLRAHHGRPGRRDPVTGERRREPRYDCQANRFGRTVCPHPVSIGRDALEREVWLRLASVLQQPAEVERLLRAYREQGGVSEADRARAAAEREAIRATLDTLDREARNLGEQISGTPEGYSRGVLMGLLDEKGRQRAGLLSDLRDAEARLAEVDEVIAHLQGFEAEAGQLVTLMGKPGGVDRLYPLAVRLFRPRVRVHPRNPEAPDRPWEAAGPRRVEVGFGPDVPGAVRSLLAGIGASGNDEVWNAPPAGTPPWAPPYLAVAPDGAVFLAA
jgi:DNA invertase Pin-like site-specific DNA recombinase